MRRLLLVAGPLLFLLLGFFAPLPQPAAWTAGVAVWMALWWITEVIDPAVTALLPLVLFPVCGVMPIKTASSEFGNDIIFLFIAGFFFGKAIERWQLHRRIALRLVLALGASPRGILLGFMVATAFVSMWISNTATAVMMMPVAVAVAGQGAVGSFQSSVDGLQSAVRSLPAGEEGKVGASNFDKALLLGVGYACSIGGMATIVGTPTNGIFLTFVQQKMGTTVTFWQWFVFGAPFSALLLLACWALLLWLFPLEKSATNGVATAERPVLAEAPATGNLTAHRKQAATGPARTEQRWAGPLRAELRALGPLSVPEMRLLAVFGTVIFAWITGSLLWYKWLGNGVGDSVIAVAGAVALFLVPAGRDGERTALLDWPHAVRIPWGIVLFFGGGLALARGFEVSGLAAWMGDKMTGLQALPTVVILLIVFTVVVILSELASNIATASMMMPVLAALAASLGLEPMGLLFGAALASSIGFGLPIATAPNSIVFSSGHLTTRDMARAGFLLDAVAIALLLAFVYLVPM